ncbi:MAG: alpha/beta hydrolase [Pseudolysinimonas sp.]
MDAPRRRPDLIGWIALVIAAAAVAVVVWALVTEWGGITHGHPAYAVLLGLAVLAAIVATVLTLRRRVARRGGIRRVGRIVLLILAVGGVALIAWLRPHTALEPALAAMESGGGITVTESATEIVLAPATPGSIAVFYQPGALVDARAYAAVLRPVAEAGHTVVIAKQPLGIGFLALGAFDAARAAHPGFAGWVLAGHSLGGTVAAIEADAADADAVAPAAGLAFCASYPAGDIRTSLTIPVESISGTRDGLATPQSIAASRADLPSDAEFTIIDGASHAQCGDYGLQSGDGTPSISDEDARSHISAALVRFVETVAG